MTYRSFKRAGWRSADEKGVVIVMMIFGIAVMLLCVGLALDAANLFRVQVQLQKAADAGALAGIGHMIFKPAATNAEVDARAAEIAQENLFFANINNAVVTTAPAFDGITVNVRVEAPVPFLIMDAVPFEFLGLGRPGAVTVAAEASSQRAVANVELVLDFSNSMMCPSTGACTCLQPERTAECESLGVTLKRDDLRTAANSFISRFNSARDRIGLTLFNTAASVKVNIASRTLNEFGFDPADFNVINTETATGDTNISDGLLRAYGDMLSAGILGNEEAAYVLFSDGAPTAARFLFANPGVTNGLPANNPAGLGAYDYSIYGVEWVNTDGTRYMGPSLLVESQALPFGHATGDAPLGAQGEFVPICSSAQGGSVTVPISAPDNFDWMYSQCLQNFGFYEPDGAGPYASEFGGTLAPYPFRTSWRQQFYNVTVQMTDFLRRRRGTVYVVGLGEPSSVGADPYQDVSDRLFRKDVLLARAANDYVAGVKLAEPDHPAFSYTSSDANHPLMTYAAWNSLANRRQGAYLATPNASQLNALFQLIAQRILLRLIR